MYSFDFTTGNVGGSGQGALAGRDGERGRDPEGPHAATPGGSAAAAGPREVASDRIAEIAEKAERDRRTEDLPSRVEEALPPLEHVPWTVWRSMGSFLARMVLWRKPESVLEFGAGRSSLVLARALAQTGGGRLTSLEHRPEHSADLWRRAERSAGVDTHLVVSPLQLRLHAHGPTYAYADASAQLARRGSYDLVFIDAPPFYYGRDGTLPLVRDHLRSGALILMDDARRRYERRIVRRWQRTFPGLRVVLLRPDFGGERGYGLAVLSHPGSDGENVSPRTFLETALDWLWNWRHIRWKMRSILGDT